MKRLRLSVVLLCLLAGCTSRKFTTTPRSAVEQMLLSGAVDAALGKFDMPMLRGAKVFLDFENLKATDAEYAKVALRAKVGRQGATLVQAADKAEYVMEVAAGALATEHKEALIGLPSIPVPQVGMPLPEAPLFKTVEQTGIVKLLLFVHRDGEFVASDLYYAKCDRDESFLLWWRFDRRDEIREGWERADLKLTERAAAKAAADAKEAPSPAAPRS